jgi:hypothetical protein
MHGSVGINIAAGQACGMLELEIRVLLLQWLLHVFVKHVRHLDASCGM